MVKAVFVRSDVLWDAERTGLMRCPCGASYSVNLRKCPQCGRPNPWNFRGFRRRTIARP